MAAGTERNHGSIGRLIVHCVLTLASAAVVTPFAWALLTSLKSPADIASYPPHWLPHSWRFDNWIHVWSVIPLARFFVNTAFVAVVSVVGQVLSCSLVAYGFARFRFPFRRFLFGLVMTVLILPPIIYLIPQYSMWATIGALNTYVPLIVPWWLAAGPGGAFGIFLLRQFFRGIPHELSEAAALDGAGPVRTWAQIIMPLTRPALAVVAVFGFVWHWNDFPEPLVYLQSEHKFTLSVGLRFLQASRDQNASTVSQSMDQYLMAAALICCIPPLVLYLVAQKRLIRGINLTGGK